MSDKQYVTQEKYEELEEELEELKTEGRKEVAEKLKKAKAMGDLSENFEYQEAKDEKEKIEKKINELENLLRNAEIIEEDEDHDEVQIGAEVTIAKDGEEKTYTIVGSAEANPAEGLISNESPIGKSLLGAEEGDEVDIKTPKGTTTYEVVSID